MYDPRLLIIIPAHNEGGTLQGIVKKALQYGDVVVLNDASTDETAEEATSAGAVVVSNECNLGYERTLGLGFKYAIEATKYKFLVSLDGDGEHNPDDIPRYLQKLSEGADLVCGVRSHKNRISETVWGCVVGRLYGIEDALCGFKGYSLCFIREKNIPVEPQLGDLIGNGLLKQMINVGCVHQNLSVIVSRRDGASKFGSGIKVNIRIISGLLSFLRA